MTTTKTMTVSEVIAEREKVKIMLKACSTSILSRKENESINDYAKRISKSEDKVTFDQKDTAAFFQAFEISAETQLDIFNFDYPLRLHINSNVFGLGDKTCEFIDKNDVGEFFESEVYHVGIDKFGFVEYMKEKLDIFQGLYESRIERTSSLFKKILKEYKESNDLTGFTIAAVELLAESETQIYNYLMPEYLEKVEQAIKMCFFHEIIEHYKTTKKFYQSSWYKIEGAKMVFDRESGMVDYAVFIAPLHGDTNKKVTGSLKTDLKLTAISY